jgi:hypothetical protein
MGIPQKIHLILGCSRQRQAEGCPKGGDEWKASAPLHHGRRLLLLLRDGLEPPEEEREGDVEGVLEGRLGLYEGLFEGRDESLFERLGEAAGGL